MSGSAESFEPVYESAKRVAIRARLVAVMKNFAGIFGCSVAAVHEIAQREFEDDELPDAVGSGSSQ
jgi:hypothetical protein